MVDFGFGFAPVVRLRPEFADGTEEALGEAESPGRVVGEGR